MSLIEFAKMLEMVGDVRVTNLQDNDTLAWNAAGEYWENVPLPTGGGGTVTNPFTVGDIVLGEIGVGQVS